MAKHDKPASSDALKPGDPAPKKYSGPSHYTWDGNGALGSCDALGRGCHWDPGDVIPDHVCEELIETEAQAAAFLTRRVGEVAPADLRSNFGKVRVKA